MRAGLSLPDSARAQGFTIGFRVWGSGFGVQGLEFGVQGLGFRVRNRPEKLSRRGLSSRFVGVQGYQESFWGAHCKL